MQKQTKICCLSIYFAYVWQVGGGRGAHHHYETRRVEEKSKSQSMTRA